MLKYSDNFVEESASDNLLGNNLLGDDLLDDNSPLYINNNIDINTKATSNPDEDMTSNNLLKKNSRINIEDLFQWVQDQTACKRLTKDVLEQTCSFF